MDDALALNRANWDARAAVHGTGPDPRMYDIDALVAGRDAMTDLEWGAVRRAVGDVAGRDVLHLQCHLAFDGISLARAGARVTGVDLSPASLAKARDIADRCGVAIDLVEADAQHLPASLHGRFDLVYATIGVLCWIGDLDAWMRGAAACLRPGGALVLVELHPLYNMIGEFDPLRLDFPYAFDGPRVFDEDGTYTDPDAKLTATTTVEYGHSIGEIVTAALDAGLVVRHLAEHLDAPFDPRGGGLTRDPDGRYRLRVDGELLPVLLELVATRPGG